MGQTLLIDGVAVMLQHQLRCGVVHLDQEIALGIQSNEALRQALIQRLKASDRRLGLLECSPCP